MNVSIELDSSTGHLQVIFENSGQQCLKLRDLFPPFDVLIENDHGERAEFYLSMPYGATVKKFVLEPGKSHRSEVNLAREYLYPRDGTYTVWIDYDSSKVTAKYDNETVDVLRCKSNSIRFPLTM